MENLNLKQMAQKVQDAGKGGDVHLIHVNARELRLIRELLGKDGTINEDTGLLSFVDEGDYQALREAGWTKDSIRILRRVFSQTNNWSWAVSNTPKSHRGGGRVEAADRIIGRYEKQQDTEAAREDERIAREEARKDTRLEMELAWQQALQAETYRTEKFPEWRQQARESVEGDVPWLNKMLRGQFNDILDDVYPEWRTEMVGAAARAQRDSVALTDEFRKNVVPQLQKGIEEMGVQAMATASSLLRGEIPADVAAQIRRNVGEMAETIGAFGESARNLVARDFGLKSLQLQQQGLQQAPASMGLAAQGYGIINQTLQAPVATGANVTNLMSAYRAPLTDPAAWYQNYVGLISGQGAVSASTAFGTAAQVAQSNAQLGQQAMQFRTQLGQQSYWNQLNYGLQQQAIREASSGGGFNLGGAIAGGLQGFAAGNWPGAIAGAAAGSGALNRL